jgi:beta-galactosidase/beta-glucuronidase
LKPFILFVLAVASSLSAQQYTRGVGLYPGDPKEYHGPEMVIDATTYRNLALDRPVYQSSAYDYNLTAQLVTDGIRTNKLPRWIVSSTGDGVLPKFQREHLVDSNPVTATDVPPTGGWVQLEMAGGDSAPEVDRVEVSMRPQSMNLQPQPWTAVVLTSDDGQTWIERGRATNNAVMGTRMWFMPYFVKMSVPLTSVAQSRFYRIQLDSPGVGKWTFGDMSFFDKNQRVQASGPFDFTSAWKSAGAGEEWVYVDLGADCTFDRVVLAWIHRAAEGSIQVSKDAKSWRTIQTLPGVGDVDDLKLSQPEHGRYVRALMERPASPDGYILSEFEVYGRGGLLPKAKPAPGAQPGGMLELASGDWRLQRDSLVAADGAALSKPGFDDKNWLPATVPGTILSSYLDDGAVPDPNYGDNQLTISDSFFYADFWYRNQFVIAPVAPGHHVWLNFDGVNWKAEVFFNGEKLGQINGGFTRAQFDVTPFVRPGAKNALAVLIHKNASPGAIKEKTLAKTDSNGGILGADNPTMHSTIGWDWIPTMRGRDTGIWNRVYLTNSGAVTIEKPLAYSTLPLPDTSRADVTVEATLHNQEQRTVSGTLRGKFGNVQFAKHVTVPAASTLLVRFDPSAFPALRLQNPKLWWPAGYGAQNLYKVQLSFENAPGAISDTKSFQTGVREFSYSEEGGALKMWINGRRFIARGGNWGFPESMLRYRSREYDVAMRYHQEMNFTMIRNWVGQDDDDALYEAADKHGIVIWQDFWLANPWDGPDPDDNAMFMQNATDLVERIRNHPSVGLYCGRNEGYPPKPLNDGLIKLISTEHPGLHYIPNSAWDVVSGGGPYQAKSQKFYFEQRATEKMHSELGMPNIVTMDSLKQMMPESAMWPQNDVWGMHDFTLDGAQNGASYREMLEKSYGSADNAADWVELAQFENYDGYRAMFEAQSKNRMGALLWMSHPTWPNFVWQTYDYYFDPTAAYFGSKKASEPLHIQWNPLTDSVEVVNYSGGNNTALTAQVELRNMDGSVQWQKSATVNSKEDSVVSPITMQYPASLSPVHYIRLKLMRGSETVSENFYLRGVEEGNYRAIRDLPMVAIDATTQAAKQGTHWVLTTELSNTAKNPALMVRVKAVREKSGDRILPAIYSDNYVALMPGEKKTIHTELEDADTRGERPRIVIEGFNAKEAMPR